MSPAATSEDDALQIIAETPPEEPPAPATSQPAPTPVPAPAPIEPGPDATPAAPADDLSVNRVRFEPGTGLIADSRDGKFSIALRSRIQLRYEATHEPGAAPPFEHVFMVRRARFQVAGHLFGEHNKYKLQLALSPRDMNFGPTGAERSPVLDAIISFDYLRDFTVSLGQFMVPFSRQRIVSSGDFELVDRSIAQAEFQLDRDIGIQVGSNDVAGLGRLRYLAGVFMGEGRDAFTGHDGGLLYVARVEVLPLGDADSRWDYEEGDHDRVHVPRLSLGGAYAYQDRAVNDQGVMGSPPSDGGTTDFHVLTADAVLQFRGASLMGEFAWRRGQRDFGTATITDDMGNEVLAPRESPRDGLGWFVQAGYIVPRVPVGVAGRYSQLRRTTATSSITEQDELGGGPSWYLFGHDLKLQADYFWIWNDRDFRAGGHEIRVQISAGF
ncbi:porin [Enhygromyxa salina]|nr:porin [Enhygromyxa salina]